MHQERGNFLLQSLLALGFIFAFIPMLSRQLNEHNIDTKMFSTTRQVELAQTAAKIFIRENTNNLPYDTTVIAGNEPFSVSKVLPAVSVTSQDETVTPVDGPKL